MTDTQMNEYIKRLCDKYKCIEKVSNEYVYQIDSDNIANTKSLRHISKLNLQALDKSILHLPSKIYLFNKKIFQSLKSIKKSVRGELELTDALKLNKIQEAYPNIIKSIRGKGFLIGIQLHKDQTYFIKKLLENRLLTIRASENVIRILPPLNVKKSELDLCLKIINKVCKELN